MALSDSRRRHQRNTSAKRSMSVPGTASTQFYAGGLVNWNASASTVEPAADTASERFAGVCAVEFLTTTASENILVEWGHSEWFPHTGIAAGQEGKDAVVSTDGIVTDTAAATNDVSVGRIEEIATIDGTAGVWVTVGVFSGNTEDQVVTGDFDVTGDVTVGGTLDVTGATGVDGDFDVATSKFTVASASGNTLVAGTLDATGDVAVNTNKFTVTAASGNTAIAGTLGVTGVLTTTGGHAPVGGVAPVQQWNHSGEGVITARGADGVSVAGTIYYGGWIPEYNQSITNVNVLMGSTNGSTDKIIVGIYNLDGTLARSSALAGVAMSTPDLYLQLPLTAALAVTAGTEYLVAIQVEGTTDTVQRHQTSFRAGTGRTGSQAGAFGTMATISSVATTFTTALGPLFFTD